MAKYKDKDMLDQIDEGIDILKQPKKEPKPITKKTTETKAPGSVKKFFAKPEAKSGQKPASAAAPQKPSSSKGRSAKASASSDKRKLRIIPLGGVDSIGKNITAFEFENDIIIVDCGLAFPEDDMLGIDLVIPDITYLEQNASKVRGIFLTHGHEDHIGAVPYVLKKLNVPIYGMRLTLGILEGKLEEHKLLGSVSLNVVPAGEKVSAGNFSVEFIRVSHSIPDAAALCIETPVGRIIHSGDFKIDLTPVSGESINLGRLAELGNSGVRLLMCESTNVERTGFNPTEKTLYNSFDHYFANHDKRLVVATFSSNVHRVQQIINTAAKHERKVVVTGRSMLNVLSAATRLGYINVPEGILIDINEMKRYSPGQIALITTGSQGEPMSALYRMAFGEHSQITIGSNDQVILSSSPIPGNEKLISNIINELLKRGAEVINDDVAAVHVSGHACLEELKIMHALTRPQCFIPIHGEYKHLKKHAAVARELGMPDKSIMLPQIGRVIELGQKTLAVNGEVTSGVVMVDGYSVGDVGVSVLRDRKHLAEDGILIVVAVIDSYSKSIVTGPDISTKGFVYAKESDALLEELRLKSQKSIDRCLTKSVTDSEAIKLRLKDELSSVIYQRTKRRPMIVPVLLETSL